MFAATALSQGETPEVTLMDAAELVAPRLADQDEEIANEKKEDEEPSTSVFYLSNVTRISLNRHDKVPRTLRTVPSLNICKPCLERENNGAEYDKSFPIKGIDVAFVFLISMSDLLRWRIH